MTQVVSQNGSGGYNLTLPRATNPIIGNDEFAMVGGQPFIILEHLLFDLGAKPAVFDPTGGIAALQFGLNLPAGIITQDIVSITIYDEVDNIVWANSGLFSNGEHRWEWDGRNGQSGEPVPNGLYHYEISLPNQGNYIITGVVGVSQPGVLACFFNATPPQPPDYYPPSPNQAFVDYRGSETYDEIDFYWPTSPPIPELEDNDNWIARYVGYLEVETAGMYQFRLGDTDDVARLFVNGALILMPDWITLTSDEPLDLYSPDVYLSEGLHTIVIEHAQIEGSASLQLLWRQAAPRSLWLSVDTLWLPGDALTDVCEQVRVDIGAFRNGDFEDGLNDWIGEPASHQWELTTEAHNGDYAAFGSSHTHLGPSSLRSAPFRVAENSCYTVSLFLQENYPSHHITFFFKTNLV
ncbi:MAG: hypothetical protein KJ063_25760 [Anaerolineae bacterium]|nr:hypothetical protein [Anaerolineae bacterium]